MQAVLDEARQEAHSRQSLAAAQTEQRPIIAHVPVEAIDEPAKTARRWSDEERQRMQAVLDKARELARHREAVAQEDRKRQKALDQTEPIAAPATAVLPKRLWSDDERSRIQAALEKVSAHRKMPKSKNVLPASKPDPFGQAPWTAEFRNELQNAVAQLRQARTLPATPLAVGEVSGQSSAINFEVQASSAQEPQDATRYWPTAVSQAPNEPVDVPIPSIETQLEFTLPKPPGPIPPRWFGEGERVSVGGYLLPGLVSVAPGTLPKHAMHMSTIDASLEVRKGRGGGDVLRADGSIEVKSYRDLLPASRDSYLRWLESGCVSYVPAHLVLLYMTALEARVVEVGPNSLEPGEREHIRKKLDSLCARFRSLAPEIAQFEFKLSELLTVASLPTALYRNRLPCLGIQCPTSLLVRAALGQAAHDRVAVPPAWVMQCIRAKLSSLHHTDEFLEVFTQRYLKDFPDGLPLVQGRAPVQLEYTTFAPCEDGKRVRITASVECSIEAEVSEADMARLAHLYKQVNASLAVYERYIKTNRRAHGTPDAEVRFPRDFLLEKYKSQLQDISAIRVSAEDLAVTLWGEMLASPSSTPFLKALLNARPRATAQEPSSPGGESGKSSKSNAVSKKLTLDMEKVAKIHAETAKASQILGGIFSEEYVEDGTGIATAVTESAPTVFCYPGLDTEHTALLVIILERERWSRTELEAIALGLDLMLDGALEQLNEAALDTVGDPLLEDVGDLMLDLATARAIAERGYRPAN